MNFALLPVLTGLIVGVATIITFSAIFDDTPVRTSTRVIPQDRAPPIIPIAIIVCGDEDDPTRSTNSLDNPVILIRGDMNGVDIPLCIFSSSPTPNLYQLHVIGNTDLTPPPAGIHATLDYPVISTPPHKGSGTGQSIQRNSNGVGNGEVMKNKLQLWADNTTDPAIEYITIEAREMKNDWYTSDVYVTIKR